MITSPIDPLQDNSPEGDSHLQAEINHWLMVLIGPILIMIMAGSFLFFMVEVFYRDVYSFRLCYVFALFVMAAVLISRISIDRGRTYAVIYAVPLGLATVFVGSRFASITGPFAFLSPLVFAAFIGIIWWFISKLTWDCTVVDISKDVSKQGLVKTVTTRLQGLDDEDDETSPDAQSASAALNSNSSTQQPFGSSQQQPDNQLDAHRPKPAQVWGTAQTANVPSGTRLDSADHLDEAAPMGSTGFDPNPAMDWWKRLPFNRRRQNAPGVWVIYFALAALPIFGLGQAFIPATDSGSRVYVFMLFAAYMFSSLTLLVTTSLMSLQRYLQKRDLTLPNTIAITWLAVGAIGIGCILAFSWMLPRPAPEISVLPKSLQFSSSKALKPSRYGWGNESKHQSDSGTQGDSQQQMSASSQSSNNKSGGDKSNQRQSNNNSSRNANNQSQSSSSQSQSNSSSNRNQNNQSRNSQSQSSQSQSSRSQSNQSQNNSRQSSQSQQQSRSQNSNSSSERNSSQGNQSQSDGNQSNSQQSNSSQDRSQNNSQNNSNQNRSQGENSRNSQSNNNSSNSNSQDRNQDGSSEQNNDQRNGSSENNQSNRSSNSNQNRESSSNQNQGRNGGQNSNQRNNNGSSRQGSNEQNQNEQNQEQNRSGGGSGSSNSNSSRNQSSGGPGNNNSGGRSPQLPDLSSAAGFLGGLIKVVVVIVILALIGAAIWFFRKQIATAMRNFINELKELLKKLFGFEFKPEEEQPIIESQQVTIPVRRFRDFADPFENGQWKGLSPKQLFAHTFAAFEAWGNDYHVPREVDQTPKEYAKSIKQVDREVASLASKVADGYSMVAYAPPTGKPIEADLLRKFWQVLRNKQPM